MIQKASALGRRLLQRDWVFACLVALLFTLPIAALTLSRHATIAPLNILSGCCDWRWVPTNTPATPIPSDVTDFVLPDRFYVHRAFSQGQIPLWNPSYFGGEVFFGNLQSTVLHPINLLFLATNELNVQTASVLLSLFLLAVGMVLMLRALDRSRLASAVGALAITGCCFTLFWAPFGMMVWMMAGIPFAIYWYLRWKQTGSRIWLGMLTLCLGVQLYFGHIQFSFAVYIILAGFVLYDFFFNSQRAKGDLRRLCMVGGALIAGVLIGSAQLMPFLEQSTIGHRADVVLVSSPTNLQGVGIDLRHFVAPYTFRPVTTLDFFNYGPFRFSIGMVPGLLAVIGSVAMLRKPRQNKLGVFFVALFVVGALWMWGSLPQQALNLVSSTFKALNPRYFMVVGLFAAAALAAYGFDIVWSYAQRRLNQGRFKKTLRWGAGGIVAVSVVDVAYYGIHATVHRQTIGVVESGLVGLALLAIFFLAPRLTTNIWLRRSARLLVPVFALANGLLLFCVTQPLPSKALFTAGNPNFDYIRRDSHTPNLANVRAISPYSPQTNLYYGISTLNGYDSLYAKDTERFIDAINYPEKTVKLSSGSHNAIYVETPDKGTLFENMGIGYVIAKPGTVIQGYTQAFSDPATTSRDVVLKAALPAPEVYFASSVKIMNRAAELNAIKSNNLDYHQIMIEHGNALSRAMPGSVTYDFDINKVHIHTNANKENYLLVGQTYRKQWKAYVDGRPLAIVRADYNFMALRVPGGKHDIEMVYDPQSFKLGVAVTAVSIVGVLWFMTTSVYTENYQSIKEFIKKKHHAN